MSTRIVQERLNQYQPKNQIEEENALKEITQEIALSGLARAGFFKLASFQGGTCLRILHGLNRFSEDLDFSLIEGDSSFDWTPYLKSLQVELGAYGYELSIQDRSSATEAVKGAFIKDDSIGKLLVLNYRNRSTPKALRIKLEIDTSPPKGAVTEQKYIDFPVTVPVLAQDLPTLFAGKTHALLCRPWDKGRDWYDFVWYVSRRISPNFNFLAHALRQSGPWKGRKLKVDPQWFLENMREKVRLLNWEKQKTDVARFLKESDLDLLQNWGREFFLNRLDVMAGYLK